MSVCVHVSIVTQKQKFSETPNLIFYLGITRGGNHLGNNLSTEKTSALTFI